MEGQGKNLRYNINMDKEVADKVLNTVVEVGKEAIKTGAASLGAATAGGATAAAFISKTSGLPMPVRIGGAAVSAGAVALSTKLGIDIGRAAAKKDVVLNMIKESPHVNTNPERIPSPDINIIHNMTEIGDLQSPLEELLRSQLKIGILLCFIIIFILFLIVYYYISSKNIQLLIKYIPNSWLKFLDFYYSKTKFFSISTDFNKKFIILLLIINSFVLIFLLVLNIYVSAELTVNLDQYISVQNYTYKVS